MNRRRPRESHGGWYALSLGLFQVAMLAKTAVSFLPVDAAADPLVAAGADEPA